MTIYLILVLTYNLTTRVAIVHCYIYVISADTIQLHHTFSQLRIVNNTIINQFRESEGEAPLSKREIDSLFIDCVASQGDHEPMWFTANSSEAEALPVDGENGVGVEMISNYAARLSVVYLQPEYAGLYLCKSGRSNAFVEAFVTTGRMSL